MNSVLLSLTRERDFITRIQNLDVCKWASQTLRPFEVLLKIEIFFAFIRVDENIFFDQILIEVYDLQKLKLWCKGYLTFLKHVEF